MLSYVGVIVTVIDNTAPTYGLRAVLSVWLPLDGHMEMNQ